MPLTLAAFALMIGVLIFVHEAGHFIAAKLVGIQVHRFSLGFGKPLVSFRWGETEYVIAVLPFGGYVKMAGLEDEGMMGQVEGGPPPPTQPVDPARAFDRKPLPARIVVILAGVAMNLVLAYVVITGQLAVEGEQFLATTRIDSVDVGALPPGAGALATLASGDRLLTIGADSIRDWGDVTRALDSAAAGPLAVRTAAHPEPLVITITKDSGGRGRDVAAALEPLLPARIGIVVPGQPAYRAGLRPRDLIVGADGDTIRSWSALLHVLWSHPGRPLTLRVRRADSTLTIALTPDSVTDRTAASPRPRTYGQIGAQLDLPIAYHREGVVRALGDGFLITVADGGQILGSLRDLVLGRVSVGQALAGPVAIAQVSGQVARLGVSRYLDFLSVFSINLAFLNLLPIPLLDGGQLVFLIAEGIRRRPLSIELRMRLLQIGFVIVVGLMLFVVGNDVLHLLVH